MPTTKRHHVAYACYPTESFPLNLGRDWRPNPALLADPAKFFDAELVEPARYLLSIGATPIVIVDTLRQTPEWKMGPDGKRVKTGRDMLHWHYLGWCDKINRPDIRTALVNAAKTVRGLHRDVRVYLYGALYADWRKPQASANDTAAMTQAYRLLRPGNPGDWKIVYDDQLQAVCPWPFNGIFADGSSQHLGSSYLGQAQKESHIPAHDEWHEALAKVGVDMGYEANVTVPGYTAPSKDHHDRTQYFLGDDTEKQVMAFAPNLRTDAFRYPVCRPEWAHMPNIFACDTWSRIERGKPFPFEQWALIKRLCGVAPMATRFWWDKDAPQTPVDLREIKTTDERQRQHYRDCLAASRMEV